MTWLEGAGNCQVLLGNGFSMAYDRERFGYQAFAARIETRSLLSQDVLRVMDVSGCTDFEQIMHSFLSSAALLRALEGDIDQSLPARLEVAAKELGEALAKSIAQLHPRVPGCIEDSQYRSTRRFLGRFSSIYTLNYDLLLYWSLMRDLGPETPRWGGSDGFTRSGPGEDLLWSMRSAQRQSVHYLHGAMHLFAGAQGVKKASYGDGGKPLIHQTLGLLKDGLFPIYVAEGSSSDKLSKIRRSPYLSWALKSLSSCSGGLAIFGHSLADNDEHVLDAIVESGIARLAISIYGSGDLEANREIIQKGNFLAQRRAKECPGGPALAVQFYKAETVGLWSTSG